MLTDLGWKVDCTHALDTYSHLAPLTTQDYGLVKNAEYVSSVCKSVSESVAGHASKGYLALTLGGDHSLAMGTISGSAGVYPNLGVLWIDAHADINTLETTTSGNLHGCPVSFLMGLNASPAPFEWLRPCLDPSRIVYIGLRDIDAAEKLILRDLKIKVFSMHDIDRHGIGTVMEMALEYLGDCPLHMSFDVDALDPSVAPSTGTPVRGGLTFREGRYVCERVCQTKRLVALDIMEVNPGIGGVLEREMTVDVGCSLTRYDLADEAANVSVSLGETLL